MSLPLSRRVHGKYKLWIVQQSQSWVDCDGEDGRENSVGEVEEKKPWRAGAIPLWAVMCTDQTMPEAHSGATETDNV